MALAPVGTLKDDKAKADEAVTFIDGLVAESNEVRSRREAQADLNLNLYLGNHWTHERISETVEQLTANRIQNAIISQVAIQTEETPKVKFTPRESLEPPVYFINTSFDTTPTPDLAMLLNGLPPETKEPWVDEKGETQLPRALTNDEVQMVEAAIDAAARIATATMTETTIPPDVLVGVTDRIAAEALQTIFDAKWDECEGDFKIGENLLYSGIIGWQWMVCEWDDDEHVHILRNVPFLQVHVDPLCTGIKDAQYVIYDQILSADEAAATFPQLQASIREKATDGVIKPSGSQYRQASVYNTRFQHDMIPLRTAWLRNQPVPLSVEEAVERQLVEAVTDTVDIPTECTCGVGVDQPVSMHHETCPCREGYEFNPETLAVPDAPAPDLAEADQQETQPPPEDPAMRIPTQSRTETFTSYKLVETGEVTEEGDDKWPTRPILRQIRIIADTVVDDRECEYVDIPLSLNVNIPIPFTPYGQGEPERLAGLQDALNSVLSDVVTHWHFFSQPAEVVPESINNARPEYARDKYNHAPGTTYIIPDHLITQLQGKLSFYLDPPKAPSDGWQLINLLISLINDAAQQSEVLEGKASPSWSGEAIASLQAAAKGTIGWKSRRTETMLKHLVKLMAGNIVHRMSVDEKLKYVTKWPVQIWYELDQKMKGLDTDISVEITSGTGAKAQTQQASDMALYSAGLLSPQSVLEAAGKDPKLELHQKAEWVRLTQNAVAQLPSGQQNTVPQPPQEAGPAGEPQAPQQLQAPAA